ncbi:MAG: hypothetical protein ACOYNS_07580 [Bacteroidota bacterium]
MATIARRTFSCLSFFQPNTPVHFFTNQHPDVTRMFFFFSMFTEATPGIPDPCGAALFI